MAIIDVSNRELQLNALTFEEQQEEALIALNKKADEEYQAYLSKYPEVEKATFPKKEAEATAYGLDNTALTPYLDRLTNNDVAAKEVLVVAILAKVQELAISEQKTVATRDAVNSCVSIAELEQITI